MTTFKQDIISDIDDTFLDSDEFAVDVTYKAATIQGIFDDGFIDSADDDIAVESTAPQVQVNSTDVVGALHGETMTINSVVYKITGIQPDGTGMTLIMLSID